MYVPTLVRSGAVIGSFYSDLWDILRKVNKDDKVVLMGDFNVRLRCGHTAWISLGHHSMGKCNFNSLLLLQLCQEFDLALTNTWFRQPDKCKATWKHPCSRHWYILDYVAVRQRH